MKPTAEQQQFLSKNLSKNLMYRETYTEFYDHILSALETKPDTMSFQDAVDSIIADDFGGYAGMRGIESRYQKTIMQEMQQKYVAYVTGYLKPPLIGLTASLALLFYWVTQQAWFSAGTFFLIVIGMRMVPSLLKGTRYLWLGYMFKTTKGSVKDGAFKWLDFAPIMVCLIVFTIPVLYTNSWSDWFKSANAIGLTIFLLLCAIHTITYFRVYKDEFKTIITR